MRRPLWLPFALLLLGGARLAVAAPPDQTLAIETTGDSYVLSVPIAHLAMRIPKGTLAPKGNAGGGHPRYFYLQDSKEALIISGWFEPARAFKGMDGFWEAETSEWKKNGLPPPVNATFAKIGGWDTVTYDIAFPRGSNTHIRAHWLQAGSWIDLHLSLTSDRTAEESRKRLQSVLQSIAVSGN